MTNGATVLMPAAGLGVRMGSSVHKALLDLEGEPILLRSLRALDDLAFISEIIPIVQPDDREDVEAIISRSGLRTVRRLADGGPERQDSVYNGFCRLAAETAVVLVHDAARPLVPPAVVEAVYREALTGRSAVPGVAVKDTIKEIDEQGRVTRTPDRRRLVAVQTPQAFPRAVLARAFEAARQAGFVATDEAALVERIGEPVVVVEGAYENIKLTTPEDLDAARAILRSRGPAGAVR